MAQKRGTKRRAARRASTGKLFGSLAAVSLVAVVGIVGTRAAISATTDSQSNQFNAGEITLADNDAGNFMYQVDNALPGETTEKCIQVTYNSPTSLDSTVSLFMATPIGTVGPFVDMTVDVGTQSSVSFPDCTGFSPTATLYTGTLAAFQTGHSTAATGLVYTPNGTNPWTDGDKVVYRVSLTLQNTTRPAGADFSGLHDYTWQATSV
jgi:predicted ribosomally synthesized peptide with SipW-like signal peptide